MTKKDEQNISELVESDLTNTDSTEPAVARTETIILPKSKWMATNRPEPPKEEA